MEKQQITILFVWTQNCFNLPQTKMDNFWGIGDIIRGALKTFVTIQSLQHQYKVRFVINASLHPVGKYCLLHPEYTADFSHPLTFSQTNHYSDFLLTKKDEIPFIPNTPGVFDAYINECIHQKKQTFLFFQTNDIISETQLTPEAKHFMRIFLQPHPSIQYDCPSVPFEIIHFRLGDYSMINLQYESFIKNIPKDILFDNLYQTFISPTNIIADNNNPCRHLLLLSDNQEFKQFCREKHSGNSENEKNILTISSSNVGHVGMETDRDKIVQTMHDFYIIASACRVNTFSVYGGVSGFVQWVCILFDIPLRSLN